MEITRNADGTLVVPVVPTRAEESEVDGEAPAESIADVPSTRVLHPGEGGYDEALAQWDLQEDPDRAPAVSTATGRQEAMHVVNEVAESPDQPIVEVLEHAGDSDASAEALRHVLAGGAHAVEDFAKEVAEAEGGDPLPAHQATRIIGEVLAAHD